MKIDRDEARRIAGLAHLEFDDVALDRMAVEMTSILGYIDQLREAPVGPPRDVDVAPTPLRDDAPHQTAPRDEIAANAPRWEDGFFVVPAVIGGDK